MKTKLTKVAAFAVAAVVAATAAQADKVQLKIPFAFNPKLPNVSSSANALGNTLPALRDDIRVKLYNPGELVPPFEILDAVSTGKVDAGFGIGAYWAGKVAAAPIFAAVPFGPDTGELLAWYKRGNGAALHQEIYDVAGYNVHPLACGILAPASAGWFQKEINSLDDLQGITMRSVGLGAAVLKKVGVSTSAIPVAEIFPALEKGAIDAVELGGPAVDSLLGFNKVAKYNYFPGWHKQSLFYELLINKDVWNGMSDGQRVAVETACAAAIAETIAEGEFVQVGPLNAYAASGVEVRQLPQEVLDGLEAAWAEVAAEKSGQDAMFKKVWDDMKAFRVDYAMWRSNALLPRE